MTRRDRWIVAALLRLAVVLFTVASDLAEIERHR